MSRGVRFQTQPDRPSQDSGSPSLLWLCSPQQWFDSPAELGDQDGSCWLLTKSHKNKLQAWEPCRKSGHPHPHCVHTVSFHAGFWLVLLSHVTPGWRGVVNSDWPGQVTWWPLEPGGGIPNITKTRRNGETLFHQRKGFGAITCVLYSAGVKHAWAASAGLECSTGSAWDPPRGGGWWVIYFSISQWPQITCKELSKDTIVSLEFLLKGKTGYWCCWPHSVPTTSK